MDGTIALGPAARRPRAISMFSGMEAASVAANQLGWDFVAFSEVEPAACHTLHHHYRCGRPVHLPRPEDADGPKDAKDRAARIRAVAALPEAEPGAPLNLGDMTQVDWASFRGQVDVVVGGPPCQAFSFAGLRRSLDDDRGNLSLAYVRAIHAIEPLWSFTENVPGWLSTKDNAFGCYLGALVGADTPLEPPSGGRWGSAGAVDGPLYRAAWRVLDAQGFVPQRRRRVFVVATRSDMRGDPLRVLFETEAEVERHLGDRRDSGPLFPLRKGGARNSRPCGEARQDVARAAACGAERGGEAGLVRRLPVEGGEAGLLDLVPQGYRVHAAYSTAMTSNGDARVADPVQNTRALDTCGGFATNQGGNIIVQPVEAWIPETSTTLRARDAKGSPDSDCTQTLLPVAVAIEVPAIAFHARQDPDSGEVTGALDTDGYSIGVLTCAQETDEDSACFLHCNKGRPAGRKSAHEEMVTAKPIVETLTTDGHAQSAVAHLVPVLHEGPLPADPIAFCSKDHGADAGPISPTLRAAPHHTSHANSGCPVAICMVYEGVEPPLRPGDVRLFQDSEFGVAEYDTAGTLRAGRIPEHQMLLGAAEAATVHDDDRRFDHKGIHGGGDHGEVHPTLESTNPKQIVCVSGPAYPSPSQPGVMRVIWMFVRRLMPSECLALQGFDPGYLDGVSVRNKPLSDGPRYKLSGNSWAVPLISWVFGRLDGHLREQIGRER